MIILSLFLLTALSLGVCVRNIEDWYTVRIGDIPVGFFHTAVKMEDNAAIIHTSEAMDVLVSRGSDKSWMVYKTVMEEDQNGVGLMSVYEQQLGQDSVKMHCNYSTDGIYMVSYNGNQEHKSQTPSPEGTWVPRYQAKLQFSNACLAGETQVVIQTIRPELGPRLVNVTYNLKERKSMEVYGTDTQVTAWEVHVSAVPINMTEMYIDDGEHKCWKLAQVNLDMPFGNLEAKLISQQEAKAAAEDIPGKVLPEIVYSMSVPLDHKIDRMFEAVKARMTISLKEEGHQLILPSQGYQKVTRLGPNKAGMPQVRIDVDLTSPQPATNAELVNPEFRQPSAMIDGSDEQVRRLAQATLEELWKVQPRAQDATDPEDLVLQANALRYATYKHIHKKDLATAFASASETVRTQVGDCSEHAMLLAALLKAVDIPARVCQGLVYREKAAPAVAPGTVAVNADGTIGGALAPGVQGRFVWHMWSQAMVYGKWVDLDATLQFLPYNVGHVLVSANSFSDAEGQFSHMNVIGLIGNMQIIIDEIQHTG